MGARAGLDCDRVTGVLPILMGGTGICDEFSEKERRSEEHTSELQSP